MIQPNRLVAALQTKTAFPGVRTLERQRGKPYAARLGSNEGLFGTSPRAIEAALGIKDGLSYYNDPRCHDLIQAIAAFGGHDPEGILVDVGIDGLLGLFVRGFLDPGAVALTTHGSYPTFNYHVTGYGGTLAEVPYTASYMPDLGAMLEAAHARKARICYLANPDNPTGSFLDKRELAAFIDDVPEDCLVLLDEAYVEFVPDDLVLPRDVNRGNLVRLRTFSKAYGLASARVGYAIAAPHIVDAMNRIRLHFGVSMVSQVMARAVLEDQAFLARAIEATEQGKAEMTSLARSLGITCLPSRANFIALDFGTPARAIEAAAMLEQHDVFVRRPPEPGVDRLIRVTIGPKPLRDVLASALQAAARRMSLSP